MTDGPGTDKRCVASADGLPAAPLAVRRAPPLRAYPMPWHVSCASSRRMDGARRPRARLSLLVVFLAATRATAQPINDQCIARKVVTSVPYLDIEAIGGATLEAGEHEPACTVGSFAHSVWYDLATPLAALYQVATCGSDFDTLVQVYDGPFCGELTPDRGLCNDDAPLCGPGTHQSVSLFRRLRQKSVHVQVGSVGPTAGALRFAIMLVGLATNDACGQAREITHPVFTDVADVSQAGGGEMADRTFLSSCGSSGDVSLGPAPHSVWYVYAAVRDGTATIDTSGTNTALAVAVFKERPEGCARLGARVACTTTQSLSFPTSAGQSYRIFVATPTDVDPDRLVFRLVGPNSAPVADAGPAQTVAPSVAVALDAGASRDADGDPLTYAWMQQSGPPVALDDPASRTPRFTAPATDATLAFGLAVSDGALVMQATATVTVSATVADPDHDGVPAPADHCPNTPTGEAADADGCACGEPGHRDCTRADAVCVVGRCDPSTGRCVSEPSPRGTPCKDDGNACTTDACDGAGSCGHVPVSCAGSCRRAACDPGTGRCDGPPEPAGARCTDDGDRCTDDVCDASATCTHPATGSFAGAACQVGALVDDVLHGPSLPARESGRLTRLLGAGRSGIAVAQAAAATGNRRVARQRLLRAAQALATFSRRVRRLEGRMKIPPGFSGRLLDATQDVMARIATLKGNVAAPPTPRR